MNEFQYLVDAIKGNFNIKESSAVLGVDYVNKEIAFTPFYREDSVHLQLHGWEIVLLKDGTYYINDTSGG